MIGLKRNTVKLIPHQKEWIDIYKETESELRRLLQEEVQTIVHIGSTAIKDIVAKPIIDIAVAIESFEKLDKIQKKLIQNNYEDRGEKIGGHLFVKRKEDLTTHHIHFVLSSGKRYRDYIFFKKKLNADSNLRKQYSELKQKMATAHPKNRGEYTNAKNEFIRKILMMFK